MTNLPFQRYFTNQQVPKHYQHSLGRSDLRVLIRKLKHLYVEILLEPGGLVICNTYYTTRPCILLFPKFYRHLLPEASEMVHLAKRMSPIPSFFVAEGHKMHSTYLVIVSTTGFMLASPCCQQLDKADKQRSFTQNPASVTSLQGGHSGNSGPDFPLNWDSYFQ